MTVLINIPILSILNLVLDGIANIVVNIMTNTLSNLLSGVFLDLIQDNISSLNIPDLSLGFLLPQIDCSVFQAEIPKQNILNSLFGDLITYDGISYTDNYFSTLNPQNYVNIANSIPSIITSNDYKYYCPTATVPIISDDNTYNGCYNCPVGTSMVLTRGLTPQVLNYNLVYADSYTDVGYLPKIICATNIVQPVNNVVSNTTPALYNESNVNIANVDLIIFIITILIRKNFKFYIFFL
jgi:hypothetical protein